MATIIRFYCQHRLLLRWSPAHKDYVSARSDHAWDCRPTFRWDDKTRTFTPIAECARL